MIDDVDRALSSWVGSIVEGADVLFAAPLSSAAERATVSLYLLDIDQAAPAQRSVRRPLEVTLRYLVTVFAPDVAQEHRLLGRLVFAALERADLSVELRAIAPEVWAAFGTIPRPAFALRYPLVVERSSQVSRVRSAPEVRLAATSPVRGVVLTSGDVPVPRARIELPHINRAVYTDNDGRFDLGAAPGAVLDRPLRIVAKGVEQLVSVTAEDGGRVVIRFDPKER